MGLRGEAGHPAVQENLLRVLAEGRRLAAH
jgi:hypothetical protein